MNDQTRYQILFTNSSDVENFTAKQTVQLAMRKAELTKLGIKFTVWDTRKNSLSKLLSF